MNYSLEVKRPVMRYHGGKWRLAKWIISHFPEHRIYVEPYGGAASVLLRKPRSYSEVYNEKDYEIYNVFKVLRNQGAKLKEALYYTPFSRREFILSYEQTDDEFERARRTIVRSFMGFGSAAATDTRWGYGSKGFRVKGGYSGSYGLPGTGFRSNSNRSGTTPSHAWANYTDAIDGIVDRFRGVVLENRDAIKVMGQHDTKNTLFYVDPPYLLSTRYLKERTKCYRYEMTDEEHVALCEFLKDVKGYVILSGHENEIYDSVLKGWRKKYMKAWADGAKERKEVIWISPNIVSRQQVMEFDV